MSLFMSIKRWVKKKTALIGLAMGNVEKNALSQRGEGLENNITQERRHTEGQLMDSLINGVVTEEVEALRWRTYKVLQSMEKVSTKFVGYEKDGNGNYILDEDGDKISIFENSIRDPKDELSRVRVDSTDNYPLDLVVINDDIGTGTDDAMSINFSDIVKQDGPIKNYDENGEVVSATHGLIDAISYYTKNKSDKPVVVKRSSLSRFEIESYTKKLVVRNINQTEKLLEFYVSKYPDEFNRNSRLFISEVKKAMINSRNSDMLIIDGVKFITYKAIGVANYLEYEYKITSFDKIVDYDGNYVIKFKANIVINGNNVLEEYRKGTLDKKYENKERR